MQEERMKANFGRRLYIYIVISMLLAAVLCFASCNRNNGESPTEQPSAEQPTQAHTHTVEIIPAVAASCTEGGYTEGKKCSECGEIMLSPSPTAKLAHTPIIVKGSPATCTESGLTDGEKCSVCDAVLIEQAEIAAKGHNLSQVYQTDAENHWKICIECEEPFSPSAHEINSDGICEICGHGCAHANTEWQNIKESTCSENGIDIKVCLDCNAVVEQTSLQLLPHTPEGESTCTESVTCSVCGATLEGAKGHTPGADATCYTPQVCLICGEILISSLGHTATATPAVQPTCTEPGLDGGQHCIRCDLVMLQPTVTPATGHNYQYSMCTGCGDMLTADEIEAATLPRLDVNTSGAVIDSTETYTTCKVTLSGCEEEFEFSEISAGIRLRGNSTAGAPKKPYRVKFDKKQNILGLNNGKKFKSWVLLADYFDSTMLRTYSTFSMAKILNEGKYFSSDFTPVEVYINNIYQGVYLLCEQTQIDGNRVDIYEREDTDTSLEIGYLLVGQGGRTDEPNTVSIGTTIVTSDRNGAVSYAGGGNFSLSGGDYTEEQIAYVKRYVEGVYNVIHQAVNNKKYYTLDRKGNLSLKTEFVGTTETEKQIETIDAVFNIDACVRLCILDEIVKNLDAGTYNMYVDLSPTGDGRLTLGPPWDFDFALANTKYNSTHSPYDYYATNFTYSDGMRVNTIFVLFGNLPWFEEMIKEVWEEHIDELYAVANNLSVMTALYGNQYQRDYAHWRRTLLFHHCEDCHASFTCHADAVGFLSDWLYKRLDWLDYVWGDGEKPGGDIQQPGLLSFDFTSSETSAYLTGFRRCHGTVTENGLKLELDEAYDPYFTLDVSLLPESFNAQDYPCIEIEYMMPATNTYHPYNNMEIFLCAGSTTTATGGISVANYLSSPDGVYRKIRFDLTGSSMWNGQIHNIRIDFFGDCSLGDVMYIKSVKFLTQ